VELTPTFTETPHRDGPPPRTKTPTPRSATNTPTPKPPPDTPTVRPTLSADL
jgi:hypothetical protein